MMRPLFPLRPLLMLAGLLASGLGQAHFPWLQASPQTAAAPLSAVAMFGHGPADATPMAAARLANMAVVDGDGVVTLMSSGDGAAAEHEASETVTTPVMVLARQRPGFWSRKEEGGERLPRNQVPDAVSCVYSRNSMKALLGTGAEAAARQPVGHPLEIVPVVGLVAAADGARLRVTVRFGDQPYPGRLSVIALDEGGPRPELFDADEHGHFEVRLPSPGRWMLYARTTTPYADPSVCDENGYNATLVLTVPGS